MGVSGDERAVPVVAVPATSASAVSSLVCALAAVLAFLLHLHWYGLGLAGAAVVCGHIGYARTRGRKRAGGWGALGGMIIGYALLVAAVAILATVGFHYFDYGY